MSFKDFVDRVQFKIRDRWRLGCANMLEITRVSRAKFECHLDNTEAFEYKRKSRIFIGTIVAACILLALVVAGIFFRQELLSLLFAVTGCHIPGKQIFR
ncbi:hypothetical protein DPMN_021286 [Dreissena polymorpha]|uniref:Uncharacterized protein n=1 Tax=Dreissena polymorpha TaxID=45954 RepID=A0A9D4NML4_DREPO|nr:hypothetical protein DPMN_021286 [Dreissena polymorpha]